MSSRRSTFRVTAMAFGFARVIPLKAALAALEADETDFPEP